MGNNYPKHLSETIRVKIARDYIKRELRKSIPSIKTKSYWKKVDKDIDSWFKGEDTLRDFWNSFHGIAMGFKLKIGLTQSITAENIEWKLYKSYPLKNELVTGNLEYISPDLKSKRLKISEIKTFFAKDKKLAKKWKKEFEQHGKSSAPRDNFPIIAVEEEYEDDIVYSIHDGNRRAVLAILKGKRTIPAYIGKYKTPQKQPKNYWLPTSFLMEVVKQGEYSKDIKATVLLLKKYTKLAKTVEYELINRVLIGNNDFRKRIRKQMGLKIN